MTTNQTIDGGLRALIETIVSVHPSDRDYRLAKDELRALLDAPAVDEHAWRLDPSKRCPQCDGHGTYLDGASCGLCAGTGKPAAKPQPQGEPVAVKLPARDESLGTAENDLYANGYRHGWNAYEDAMRKLCPLYAERPAPVAADKYDDVLWPFLSLMRAELHANAHKGDRPGWLQMDRKTAVLEVFYHLGKLHQAVHRDEAAAIKEYAADVANMCMMLSDICNLLETK